jgi:hypothetical protein
MLGPCDHTHTGSLQPHGHGPAVPRQSAPPLWRERGPQVATDCLGESLGLPHPQLLVDLHQRQELRLFLSREGRLPLLGEELVKTMPLLRRHLHLRQGEHFGI